MPRDPESLGEALRRQAEIQPDAPAVTFLNDGNYSQTTWTFGELDLRARAITVALQHEGLNPGDRALILHPPGLDLVAAFFGCQYAGVVPVLTYPPTARSGSRAHQRLQRLLRDAHCRILLRGGKSGDAFDPSVRELATDAIGVSAAASLKPRSARPEDPAFLQYTSGSTGEPRGVIVSQRSALANLRHIAAISSARSPRVRVVMWVPPYHDLGLVGGILMPLASGFPTHLMDPRFFMQRPMRWLEAISRFGATTTGAPDSAYDTCARSVRDEELACLDLSSWTVAFNGSETVRPETLRRFSERFASCGFSPETLYPCYGLAESTLIVAGGVPGSRWREVPPPKDTSTPGEAAESGSGGRVAVSMGQAIPGHEVLIVSPETGAPLADREIGEIWVRGPSVADGYWNRPDLTEATFKAQPKGFPGASYLRTGDLGTFVDGELLIAGRLKGLILLRGRNLFPHDIEDTMESSHAAIEPRGCCAFSIDTGSEEVLVVLAEIRRAERRHLDATDVIEAIRRAVSREHDVAVRNATLLPPSSLPRTTSGKIQRAEARRLFLTGGFKALATFDALRTVKRTPALALESGSLVEGLRRHAAALLSVDPNAMPVNVMVRDLGLDSLMRVELLLALPAGTREELPARVLDGAVTLHELAELCRAPKPPVARPVPFAQRTDVPLSPRQRDFLEKPEVTARERFGIQVRLRTPPSPNAEALRTALRGLSEAHEALRLRFRLEDAVWKQELSNEPSAADLLEVADISNVQPGQLRAQSADFDERLITGISLEHGPLFRALLLDRGPGERGVLSIFFHHLVTDALSVAILLADLTRSYEAPDGYSETKAAPKGAGYVSWCRVMAAEWALKEPPVAEALERSWLDPALTEGAHESVDHLMRPEWLDALTDARLLERFPAARDFEALALAAFAWAYEQRTAQSLRVEIQAHGRWARHGIDPTLCVGWFAALHSLDLPRAQDALGLSLPGAALAALNSVREHRNGVHASTVKARIRMEYRSIIEDPFRGTALFPVLDVVWRSPQGLAASSGLDLALTCGHRRGRLWWGLHADRKIYAASTVRSMSADIGAYLERAALLTFTSA
jgi:acyl-CoA synthetase (AMP-forming)/AMP-acid ligase II